MQLLIGVLDGHGTLGHEVAHFLATRMPAAVFQFINPTWQRSAAPSVGDGCCYDAAPPRWASGGGGSGGGGTATTWERHLAMLSEGGTTTTAWETRSGAALMPGRGAERCSGSDSDGGALECTRAAAAHAAPWERAFAAADAQLEGSGINTEESGSTCMLAHVKGRRLTTAWVGDSRAVLARRRRLGGGWLAVPLSDDHCPSRPDEQVGM